MTNRIRNVVTIDHRLDPHETELRIVVEVDFITPATEVKGRLIGPRCAGWSTVEIAYPMRLVRPADASPGKGDALQIQMRVVIPEPSLWAPATPFLYEGPLELWQDGELCMRETVCHGIGRIAPPGP